MATATEYACNLKGTAQLALDRWHEARQAWPSGDDGDDLLLTGRCSAYSVILAHLTGIPACRDAAANLWQQSIDVMR